MVAFIFGINKSVKKSEVIDDHAFSFAAKIMESACRD